MRASELVKKHIISIRTPARGVTYNSSINACEIKFQFAPPRGG